MSTELIETWIGPIAAVGVAFGTLAHYFRAMRNQDEKREELRRELLELRARDKEELAVIRVRGDVVWSVIEKELPKVLLRPHTPELDKYFRRFHELSDTEKQDFIDLLQAVIDGNIDIPMKDDMRVGYLLAIMKLKGDLAVKEALERFKDRDGGV